MSAAVGSELRRAVERAYDALVLTAGSVTLEVRWIQPGPIPRAMLDLLGPFDEPAIERREDRYLLEPVRPLLGVKVRDGLQLDVKARHQSLGVVPLSDCVRGRLELWEKWSFPLAEAVEVAGWLPVRKLRHRRVFALDGSSLVERPIEEAETACTVELTEVTVADGTWWTLGFEAGGQRSVLEPELRAAAAQLIGRGVPPGIVLDGRTSTSYVHWLPRRR